MEDDNDASSSPKKKKKKKRASKRGLGVLGLCNTLFYLTCFPIQSPYGSYLIGHEIPLRWWIMRSHNDWRGERVSARTLAPEGGGL